MVEESSQCLETERLQRKAIGHLETAINDLRQGQCVDALQVIELAVQTLTGAASPRQQPQRTGNLP